MKQHSADYIHLLSSLPRMPAKIDDEYHPVTAIKLARRLSLLAGREQAVLKQLRQALSVSTVTRQKDTEQSLRVLKHVSSLSENPYLRALVGYCIDARSAVAALVARNEQRQLPGNWTSSRLRGQIQRRWQEQDFGLTRALPWLARANKLISKNEYHQLEQLFLRQLWLQVARADSQLDFEFAKVVIYAMRWDLIRQWQQRDQATASQRFAEILESLLLSLEQMNE